MKWISEKSWREHLAELLKRSSIGKLGEGVDRIYSGRVFPPREQLFRAFELTPFDKVKIVIVGQDPYHTRGAACGLAFSVCPGIKIPPSLRNILKEVESELGQPSQVDAGDLTVWAEQGVLLLNSILTVEEGQPASHRDLGWEEFTDGVLKTLSDKKERLVFMLWGTHARKKASLIDSKKHLILESVHPSPLSARLGFFGCGHFKEANEYLRSQNKTTITW